MIIAAAALGGALSAALLGHFGDSWGHRRILVWCSIAAAAASLGHAVVNSIAALFVVRILFGISVAAMMPAANAIIQAVTDRDHIGKAYGAATALSMAGIAAGPFLGGTIANAFGLRAPFIVTAVGQVLIVLLVMAVLPASAGMAVMPRKET
jgi:MFS family permease